MTDMFLLKNIRIFQNSSGRFSAEQDVLAEHGVIRRIGSIGSAETPSARVLDCGGRYLLPGLWECHAHVAEWGSINPRTRANVLSVNNLPDTTPWLKFVRRRAMEFLLHGVTHIRDVGGPLKNMLRLKQAANDGKLIGPEIYFAGPMLEKPPLFWSARNKREPGFTVPVDSVEDAGARIEYLARNGVSLIKTFNKFDPDVFAHVVRAARDRQLPVTHDPGGALFQWMPVTRAMDAGVTCFEHAQAVIPSILAPKWADEHEKHVHSPPEDPGRSEFVDRFMMNAEDAVSTHRLNDLCDSMAENNIFFCPTVWTLSPLRTEFSSPPPNERERCRRQKNENFCRVLQRIVQTMAEHDVKILVGHDSASPNGTHAEIELLAEWGVAPGKIIRGATSYPAEWLGQNDRYGEISEGKSTDLVIVDRDPTEDISNIRAVWAVCHGGALIPVTEDAARAV